MHRGQPGVIWPKDRRVTTEDGAEIAYTLLGPDGAGPVLALCSGFLCPDTWWYHLVPALEGAGHRVLLFHYRGIATSTHPADRRPDAYTVPRCAGDLSAIVEHERIADLVLVGHSMGVQVMLEAYRQLADHAVGVVALTGPYASPMHTLYGRADLTYLLYHPARVLFRFTAAPLLRFGWSQAWARLPFLAIGRGVHAFGPRTSDEIVQTYVEHAAALDPKVVLQMAEAMHRYTAADVLPTVTVPALVVVGGKDPFSPPRLGEEMAEIMPDAVLRRVPDGTHGAVLEYPEQINGWVLDFLDRLGSTRRTAPTASRP